MDTGQYARQPYPYEADTEVHDPEDWRTPSVEGEEDEMQVTLDGGKSWCRVLLGAVDVTSCDVTYRFSNSRRRPPQLVGELCPKCFTPREIAVGLEALERQRREADGFIGINPRRRR